MGQLFSSALTSKGLSEKADDSLSALRSLNLVSLFSTSPSGLPHHS